MQKMMAAIGLYLNSLNRIGIMMQIRVNYKCTKYYFLDPSNSAFLT